MRTSKSIYMIDFQYNTKEVKINNTYIFYIKGTLKVY